MGRRAVIAALLLSVGLLVLAGCGSEGTVSPAPETVEGTVATETVETTAPEGPEGDATAGKSVFASAGCTGCHTLAAAGATGTVGPNLDDAKPDLATVVDRVTNGRGAMPSFKGQLDEQQIADVAAFVVASTSG